MLHQYKNNGYNIVLDVNSGSVHVVDELMYDAMAVGEKLIGEIEAPVKLDDKIKSQISSSLKSKYSDKEIQNAKDSELLLPTSNKVIETIKSSDEIYEISEVKMPKNSIQRIPMNCILMISKRERL